jgi:hypothetical protein
VVLGKLQKTWPELWDLRLDEVTQEACKEWAAKLVREIACHYYNNTLGTLKQVLQTGIKAHKANGGGTLESPAAAANVIAQWEDLKPRLTGAAAKAADDTIEYYQNNQQRMKYKQARKRKEPVGSGAIESTCRQLQCRMKRCGQFWSTRGEEALLCLEMFWRNKRWELLFPHAKITAISNN